MTLVCSYCNRVFGLSVGKAGLSHGICVQCFPAVQKSYGLKAKPYPWPAFVAEGDSRGAIGLGTRARGGADKERESSPGACAEVGA